MSFIYVTGPPGVGKSTLQTELASQGYDTRDIDDSAFGAPYNKATGSVVSIPGAMHRTPEWFEQHEWRVHPDAFERLKSQASDREVIVFGVASSDGEVIPLFDKIIYMNIDDPLLLERLKSRNENDYGKNDFEMKEIINRKRMLDEKYRGLAGVTHLDASKPIDTLTRQIISVIKTTHNS